MTRLVRPGRAVSPLTCAFRVERVTGIEPALSVWESVPSAPAMRPDLRGGVSASDREGPLVTGVNGPAGVVAQGGCEAGSPVSRKMVMARHAD